MIQLGPVPNCTIFITFAKNIKKGYEETVCSFAYDVACGGICPD